GRDASPAARSRPLLHGSPTSTGSRSSPRARNCGSGHLSRRIMGFPLTGRVHRFGWIGVDLFFVLSGYLIGGQLLAPLMRGQRLNFGTFFARRVLRIMPAYFVVLAIYFLLPSWREYPEMSQPLWKFLLSGAKHRTSWRHGIFTRMVARG